MGDLATTGGGPALARAGLPRIVVLPDGRKFAVQPPTIRDAIEILEGLPGASGGDDSDGAVVEDALQRWLPIDVLAWLTLLSAKKRAIVLQGLLFQGVDLEGMRERVKRREERAKKDERKPASPRLDWRLALSDYCQVYHAGNPWVVYKTTPFPFFMSFLDVSGAASARELLRWVEVEVVPHLGKHAQSFVDGMRKRAEDAQDGPRPACASKEEIERDRAALKAELGARP